MSNKNTLPISQKMNLTIQEAAEYSNIGINKLRSITEKEDCPFVLWVGSKRLIKRQKFEEYVNDLFSI